jgi:hypothetical protein
MHGQMKLKFVSSSLFSCHGATDSWLTGGLLVRYICHSRPLAIVTAFMVKVKQSHYMPGVAQRVSGSSAKAVLLQAWGGPEGVRKLSFPDFLTTAQDGGKVVSLKHRPHLPPGNIPGTHLC